MTSPFVSYAQNREDVILWRALGHVADGFYIDVGAASPDDLSMTRGLYERGWHGINIEPQPGHFRDLVRARPRDLNLDVAAGPHAGHLTLHAIEDTGLSTLVEEEARLRAAEGWTVRTVEVPVETLDAVWTAHVAPGSPVHFLKVDVEGYEREVLLGIDLGMHRPWVLVVEATRPTSQEPSHSSWEPLVVGAGYVFVYGDGLNRFYLAEEHADLACSFAYPPNVFDGYVTAAEVAAQARAASAEARATAAEA
ncbi:MAG: FkbM family methyltransferase, partial [Chloroflexi bacterium]|nr:FkbM family methyltransferase [Chloroflexota bacterium]